MNDRLRDQFHLADSPLHSASSGLIVADKDDKALPAPLRDQVIDAALPLLRALPDIVFVEARDRLLQDPMPDTRNPEMLTVRERMRLSAVAERSADIIMIRAQNVTGGGRVGGNIAGHGTPWDYDRRVPIVFWTPGAEAQERFLPIRTIDIAPTLAAVLGLSTPSLEGRAIPLWPEADAAPPESGR